jgi:hypothetical protein
MNGKVIPFPRQTPPPVPDGNEFKRRIEVRIGSQRYALDLSWRVTVFHNRQMREINLDGRTDRERSAR